MSELRRRKGSDGSDASDEGVLVDKPAEVETFPRKDTPEEEEGNATTAEAEPKTEAAVASEPAPVVEAEPEPELEPEPESEPEPEPEPEEKKTEVAANSSPRSILAGRVEQDASRRSVTAPAPKPQPASDEDDDDLSDTLSKVMMKKVVDRYPFLEDVFHKMAPLVEKAGESVDAVGPYVWQAYDKASVLYQNCPWEIILSLVGLLLCFFGGAFVTLIAAAEAFRMCGGSRTMRHLRGLYRDYLRVRLATRKKMVLSPDIKLKPHDYVVIAFKSVKDPQGLSSSMSGVYTAVLAVFATLRMQFARTITLGSSIGDFIKEPVIKYTKPSLEYVIDDPDYNKWLPTLLEWLCRFIGVTIAWYAQRMNAALQSSLKGGSMCVKHAAKFLRGEKYIPTTPHDDNIETVAGYTLAVIGLYCQLCWGFSVPFPLSILALPLSILESCLLFFM